MSHKLNIVFYVNGMSFHGNSLNEHSLGGSETAGLCMARGMAELGHNVVMFCNTDKPGTYDEVVYRPISEFFGYMAYATVDVCIGQRVPQIFGAKTKAKLNVLWQHDLGLKRQRKDFLGSLWNIDAVMGLSDFHINQMSDIFGIPKEDFMKTRNGIDPIKLDSKIKRHQKRLIYTARPERGLDVLLNDIMPKIWAKDKDVELVVSGYDNTIPQMKPFYDSLNAKIEEYKAQGFKVTHKGALTKKQLYKEYQHATLYVYPTGFEEISCITAMECMANGLPMVTTHLAALPETLEGGGSFAIKGSDAKSEDYQTTFVKAVLDLISGKPVCDITLDEMRELGLDKAKSLLWSGVAKEWEARFYEMFKERTANVDAVAKQLYRMEDIIALRHLNDPKWNAIIEHEYPLIKDPTAYDAMYQDYGKNFKKEIEAGIQALPQILSYPRVQIAMERLKEVKPKHILDYGCAYGNEAIQFVNAFDCKVTSVNVSAEEMEVGKELAKKFCKKPENITWVVANTPDDIEGEFDAVFAGEILEHLEDPKSLTDKLEAKCKDGGLMLFTTPFGPWGDVDIVLQQRGHLWNFDRSDIYEMFGKKKKLIVQIVGGSMNSVCNEMLGWHLFSYIRSGAETGTIDLDRKVAIQAPRETVSACMIIGGEQEGLLHRCLTSIYPVVDEIIIADTGMSKESRKILESDKYKNKIQIIDNAPNPLEVGFDEARNFSIQYAICDWILWVDSDEELVRSNNIFKYLKANKYNGYSIKQHHFSVNPPNAFRADLPVRLFRNHIGVKFFGIVHEHPERALNEGVGMSTVLHDVDIAHDGYLSEDVRRKRFARNYDLLCKDRVKHPERLLGMFLEMRDWMHLARYTLEGTRGAMTEQVVELCEKTIKCYRENFLSKNYVFSTDGLGYYSEALNMLNRGVECSLVVGVGDDNAQPIVTRFENAEDFKIYMDSKITAGFEPFEGKYV